MIKLAVLITFVMACAAATAAQVNPGARVRVLLKPPSGTAIVGTLDTLGTDSLRLHRGGETGVVAIPLREISGLEVSAGQHSHTSTGIKIGVLLGTGAGLAFALANQEKCNNLFLSNVCNTANTWVFVAIPIGGLVGTGLGAVVGSAFHSERWKKVAPPHLAIAPMSSGRMGIGFSLPI